MKDDRVDLRGGYFSSKPASQLKPPPKGPAPGAKVGGGPRPPAR
ncbi:MAG TPA: hypothetical protein VG478_12930 [Acidimicrobiales bacterium]|jgi:hypothetical protein|nr:hypothetical protein [Acidimicrobiales bacterium]